MDRSFFAQGDKLDQDYICTICSNVLTKPHSCQQGHTFCHSCISTWLQKNKKCPTCCDALDMNKLSYSRPLESIIQKLQVKCLHHHSSEVEINGERGISSSSAPPPIKKTKKNADAAAGCKWEGILADRQKHLDKDCNFTNIKCTFADCNKMVKRSDLISHQKECEFREVECEHCDEIVTFQNLSAHIDTCEGFTIDCPHGCKKKFARSETDDHELTCPQMSIFCPMASVGCRDKFIRKDLKKHMQSAMISHMELLALETHCLEWIIPDFRTKLTTAYIPGLFSKSTPCGHFQLSLSLEFEAIYMGAFIYIKLADRTIQNLPKKVSINGSQIILIHPTDSSRNEEIYYDEIDILPIGTGRGNGNFITKEQCLAEFVWPDGSLHIEATIRFPRMHQSIHV